MVHNEQCRAGPCGAGGDGPGTDPPEHARSRKLQLHSSPAGPGNDVSRPSIGATSVGVSWCTRKKTPAGGRVLRLVAGLATWWSPDAHRDAQSVPGPSWVDPRRARRLLQREGAGAVRPGRLQADHAATLDGLEGRPAQLTSSPIVRRAFSCPARSRWSPARRKPWPRRSASFSTSCWPGSARMVELSMVTVCRPSPARGRATLVEQPTADSTPMPVRTNSAGR